MTHSVNRVLGIVVQSVHRHRTSPRSRRWLQVSRHSQARRSHTY